MTPFTHAGRHLGLASLNADFSAGVALSQTVLAADDEFILEHSNRSDDPARKVVVRSRQTGDVIGTTSVILPHPEIVLPMQRLCEDGLLAHLPPLSTGQISEFAFKTRPGRAGPAAGAMVRLCLLRGIVQISAEEHLTHLCTVMERTLLRLLRATGIHFSLVGPALDLHGGGQPASCAVDMMLSRLRLEQPTVFQYVTEHGEARPPAASQSRVVRLKPAQ